MSLFNLFKKSEWSKLKKFDRSVQQDIAFLIALDSLIKYGIRNAVDKFTESFNTTIDKTNKALCSQLVKQAGANLIGYACIIDRSNDKSLIKEKVISQVKIDIPVYDPKNLPEHLNSIKAIKPGSRNL